MSGASWRLALGDLWIAVAVDRITNSHGSGEALGRGAHEVARALTGLLTDPLSSHTRKPSHVSERALSAAVLALELAAAVGTLWPGETIAARTELLRRLESRLGTQEEAALRCEPGYRVSAQRVELLAHSISEAIRTARSCPVTEVDADAVQAAFVEMAGLAVRASISVQHFGTPSGPTAPPPRGWRAYTTRLAWDLAVATERSNDAGGDPGTAWLLAVAHRVPAEAMRQVADRRTDPCLRAESLLACRHAWLERACCQLAIWSRLAPVAPSSELVLARLSTAAISLLRVTDLSRRPAEFRQLAAWNADQHRLLTALRAYLDSPQAGWSRAASAPRRMLLANVARGLVAIALIDAQLGDRGLEI